MLSLIPEAQEPHAPIQEYRASHTKLDPVSESMSTQAVLTSQDKDLPDGSHFDLKNRVSSNSILYPTTPTGQTPTATYKHTASAISLATMLRQIPTLFLVGVVLEMNICPSLALAITCMWRIRLRLRAVIYSDLVSAAIGHDLWKNTNNVILASSPERYNIENQPKATFYTRHMSRAFTSAVSGPKATATYHGTSAPIATGPPTITPKAPTPLATTQAWSMPNATNAQYATDHRIHIFTSPETLTPTYPHSFSTPILTNADLSGGRAKASSNAQAKQMSRHAATEMSTASLFTTVTTFCPNATSCNARPLNHTNTTIIAWTVPYSKASATPTPMPKSRDASFRHFIGNINSALPYLEACGLLVIVWNVGVFVQAKIKKCRGKRSSLPVSEGT